MNEAKLTTFQVKVAHTFFRLNASEGYVVLAAPRWSPWS
jgi:hypothetical protein